MSHVVWLFALCIVLIPAQAAGAGTRRINGPLAPRGWVKDFLFTPDDQWIVYVADQAVYGRDNVYSVAADGGVPMQRSLPTREDVAVETVRPSPDGQWIVYVLTTPSRGTVALYSVELHGGPARVLSDWSLSDGDIGIWRISGDSRWVVYEARANGDAATTLYRISIDGTSPPTPLNGDLLIASLECCADDRFALTPDGRYALFAAWPQGAREGGLYRASLAGGDPIRLSSPLPPNNAIHDYLVSADSQQIVYSVGSAEYESITTALYHVPTVGGLARLLIETDGAVKIGGFVLGMGDTHVVYQTRHENSDFGELYRVPLVDGVPIAIHGSVPPDKRVTDLRISPDGATVSYILGNGVIGNDALYSAPLSGGSPVLLAVVPSPDAFVTRFQFSPDSRWVVYGMTRKNSHATDLFSVRLATGTTTSLYIWPSGRRGTIDDIAISPDSTRVLFTYDDKLSQATLRSGGWSNLVQVPSVWIWSVVLNCSGTAALYRADNGGGTFDLHRIDIFHTAFLPLVHP